MSRLSVIIPMYNVEPYLERCIQSIVNQDLSTDELEIICINDGSPDGSKDLVISLQKKIPNLKLIDQKNQGVSVARNNGIDAAIGTYLLMVDPDDFLTGVSLRSALEEAEKGDYDILNLGFEILDENGVKEWQTNFSELNKKVFEGPEGFFVPRKSDPRDPDRSWGILYKSSLVRKYQSLYPEGVPYLEDGLFLVKIFSVASRVGFLNSIVYRRTTRPGSATHSDLFYSEKAAEGFIKAARDLKKFSENNQLNGIQSRLINHGIANFVLLALFPQVRARGLKRFRKTVLTLEKEGFGKLACDGVVEPYLGYAKRYNYSPCLFAISYMKDLMIKKIAGSKNY